MGKTAGQQIREKRGEPPEPSEASAPVVRELSLEVSTLAQVAPQPIRWIAPKRIPRGKLTLFAGDGGGGKSTSTLHIGASLSRGLPPFGQPGAECLIGSTLLIQCEDDWADTVVPRLLSMGADMSRIYQHHGIRDEEGKLLPFSLAHYEALEKALEEHPDIKLVVIDPAGAYIGGVDDHKDSALRSLLGPLAELAARRDVAIILVKHFSKAPTVKAVAKISGSTGYVNAVRAAFVVLPDEDDPKRSLFLPVKFNIGERPKGLSFRRESLTADEIHAVFQPFPYLSEEDRQRISETIFRIQWEGETDATADDQLADALHNRGPNKVERCANFIKRFVGDYAYPSDEVLEAAKKRGFTFDNLKEAKAHLRSEGLRSSNRGVFQGIWWCGFGDPDHWLLRPTAAPDTPHSPTLPPTPKNNDDLNVGIDLPSMECGEEDSPGSPGSGGNGGEGGEPGSAKGWQAPDYDPDSNPFG